MANKMAYDGSPMRETTRLLMDTVRVARETEEIGLQTSVTMQMQRQRLEDTRDHLDEMKSISMSAKRSIRELENKAFRYKMCLWFVILLLFCANIAVLIAMVRNGGKLYRPRQA